jgi:hypothetical protein
MFTPTFQNPSVCRERERERESLENEIRRVGERESWRKGEKATRRKGEKATGRKGEKATGRKGEKATRRIQILFNFLNLYKQIFCNTYLNYINAIFNSIISKVILLFPIALKHGESASTMYHFDIFWLGKNKFVL